MTDTELQQEITVKRISALKFEIEVSTGVSNAELSSMETSKKVKLDNSQKENGFVSNNEIQNRISVIRRAPRTTPQSECVKKDEFEHDATFGVHTCDRQRGNAHVAPAGAILIKDAIMYRIIEILLWKVLGEERLAHWGYPTTPIYRLLWNIVYYYSCFQPGMSSSAITLGQTIFMGWMMMFMCNIFPFWNYCKTKPDHDCQGDINCFMDHVEQFLDLCAPTQEIRDKFCWSKLCRDEILKKIYYEDLLPFLTGSDLSNYSTILNSYKDILQLQTWQDQGFTAISWNGHEQFSRLKSRVSWCHQCSRRFRKSVISY